MSPFLTNNSKYYKVRLKNLARYGSTPLLSTKTTNKRTAQAMQDALRDVYELGLRDKKYFELLDALKPESKGKKGKITLPDLYYAVRNNELDELLLDLTSPTLLQAVEEFLRYHDNKANRDGMNKLLRLAPEKVRGEETRLSYLHDYRNIMEMCYLLEKEVKPSTVERSFLSPLSNLVRYMLGNAERDRIWADISYKAGKASPRPLMDAALIHMFLSACDDNAAKSKRSTIKKELPTVARISLLTSADIKPIVELTPADIQIVRGSHATIHLRGTKREERNRTVPVSAVLIPHLLKVMEGKESHERLFTSTRQQISEAWYNMRIRYKLPHFRFKDLRHTFGKHAALSGIDERNAQHAMGHSDAQMTKHYAALSAKLTTQDADTLARSMGLYKNDNPLKKVI